MGKSLRVESLLATGLGGLDYNSYHDYYGYGLKLKLSLGCHIKSVTTLRNGLRMSVVTILYSE